MAPPIPEQQLRLLDELSTSDTPHGVRTLLAHLTGTRELLHEWGQPTHVCDAGLFHSIYGTQYFTIASASLERRDDVRAAIGAEAEQLAYLFCVTDRRDFLDQADADTPVLRDLVHDTTIAVTPTHIRQLIEIETANVVEQIRHDDVPAQQLANIESMHERGRPHMSEPASTAMAELIASCRRSGSPAAGHTTTEPATKTP